MNKLFSSLRKPSAGKKPVVVVSGLPRSGTSMMMKILAEGGLEVVSDAIRAADDDNPNGYFEFEHVKQMSAGDYAWVDGAGGKVVKVVSALLEYLPAHARYKIIFMEREIQEVLASQKKMLKRRDEQNRIADDEMEKQFRAHLAAVKPWLARQPNMEVIYVRYDDLLTLPGPECRRIMEFLDLPLDLQKMQSVPDAKLYRNRT
ncbi:MAG: sulfotransferase [Anaerolineales bacterium]|nr:sulfotransferase [Anaerolineales bacterium]